MRVKVRFDIGYSPKHPRFDIASTAGLRMWPQQRREHGGQSSPHRPVLNERGIARTHVGVNEGGCAGMSTYLVALAACLSLLLQWLSISLNNLTLDGQR